MSDKYSSPDLGAAVPDSSGSRTSGRQPDNSYGAFDKEPARKKQKSPVGIVIMIVAILIVAGIGIIPMLQKRMNANADKNADPSSLSASTFLSKKEAEEVLRILEKCGITFYQVELPLYSDSSIPIIAEEASGIDLYFEDDHTLYSISYGYSQPLYKDGKVVDQIQNYIFPWETRAKWQDTCNRHIADQLGTEGIESVDYISYHKVKDYIEIKTEIYYRFEPEAEEQRTYLCTLDASSGEVLTLKETEY